MALAYLLLEDGGRLLLEEAVFESLLLEESTTEWSNPMYVQSENKRIECQSANERIDIKSSNPRVEV